MINGRKCKLPNRNIREASSQLGENKFIVAARSCRTTRFNK